MGLAIFFVCAYQVYSAKLLRRGVVSGGLYAWIRHPQYLGLGIAGLGLLLYSGLAFGLRSYSKAQVPAVTESGVVAVSLSALPKSGVQDLLRASLESAQVKELMVKYHDRPDHALVAYLVPQEYMMAHLIADLGEHEAHHGKAEEQGALAVMKHLGEMYGLKPLRQLRDGRTSRERRIIFTGALASDGKSVPPRRALDVDVLRYPLFIAELNGTEVAQTMVVPRRHAWGNIPVPAF